ncbi:helix-turn-helix domain-containing protein [Streptomyces sp. NBC_00887]|uniref:transcriptional regulator n=1 Tax=Streptomyces sp. NBC_00887 TaxID=2975859 RepID=UPI00386F0F4C|nr:helix-turn-helix domain-containing protein [Streptomyces sp. NBC_00887]
MTVQTQDSVAQFAALLRELKERTDRSYGSLGRRLHMNTSTLHRYCTGEAVPLDFAPVERFAALCGASGAERLELHRRWLLAVAARQRPHPTGPLGEAEGSDAPAGRQPGDTGSGSDDGGAPTSGAAGGPAGAEGLVSGPSPAPPRRPRPWYRRKRAAAVVCAVLAAAGSLALLPDGRDTDDGARAASVAPETAAASAGPRASNTRSVSPSDGPKDGTASPPGTRREPSDPVGSTSAPAGSEPAGPPLAWSVDSHAWAFGCGHDYVIAAPPERVPPPPVQQDAGTWAATQRAVHGGETIVKLSVQGTSDTAVVLEALRVRVTGRAEPAPGDAYSMAQGCGGSLTPRSFAVDLDTNRPVARATAGNDAGTPIPAVSMPYRVSAEDPEVLLVTARTAACDCSWYLELDWSSQGRTGTARIDDRGRPFRTSAVKGLTSYAYDTSARAWAPRVD